MENVPYLPQPGGSGRSVRGQSPYDTASRRRPRARWIVASLMLVIVAVVAVGAVVVMTSKASLASDPAALAGISLPVGGGTIESVSVTTGPHAQPVPVALHGQQIWPKKLVPAHQLLAVEVTIKRPSWISWLTGKTEHLRLSVMTPSASLRSHYLTLGAGQPIKLQFKQPIRAISFGVPGKLHRQVLRTPQTAISLHRISEAGSMWVAAAPRSWETSKTTVVSWFPAGSAGSAVASPAPGTAIRSNTPITLTFNKPVSKALGSARPPVSPATAGTWHQISSHAIEFQPSGYGYGLASNVSIGLPSGVRLAGATGSSGKWTVPAGSTLRLQQLLSQLGYLPLSFKGAHVASNALAQESAAIHPPAGTFSWRYANTPSALKGFWAPGTAGEMTRGALMAFENDHGMLADGAAGPHVWRTLIDAAVAHKGSSFGYTFVDVSLTGQHLDLWHNGHTVMSTAVNTGIAQAPTAPGTYPVYEHLRVTTMSGTNPDGSHYNDPGIQFVSYFNGGDALHAFTRAQYGFPQSLGCVEMALGPAGEVWPYTPIGTLVHVE